MHSLFAETDVIRDGGGCGYRGLEGAGGPQRGERRRRDLLVWDGDAWSTVSGKPGRTRAGLRLSDKDVR